MTTAMQTPQRRSRSKLQDVSLVDGPMLLLRSIRGFSSNRSLLWLATVPLALFGLGLFNLSAHAAELPELNAAFLANNLWLLIATILVIFMNAGFAMVEAGMCRSKKRSKHSRKKPFRICSCCNCILDCRLLNYVWRKYSWRLAVF